jgi:hypothetical protein
MSKGWKEVSTQSVPFSPNAERSVSPAYAGMTMTVEEFL